MSLQLPGHEECFNNMDENHWVENKESDLQDKVGELRDKLENERHVIRPGQQNISWKTCRKDNGVKAFRSPVFFDSNAVTTESLNAVLVHLHDPFACFRERLQGRIYWDEECSASSRERDLIQGNVFDLCISSNVTWSISIMLSIPYNLWPIKTRCRLHTCN